MQTCKLCLKEKELKDSHIISEFLYKPIYDDKHRMMFLDLSKGINNKNKVILKKGVREKLLCGECEEKLSKWETYASKIIFHNVPKSPNDLNNIAVWSGIDYKTFKLFQLSLLWRASISNLPEFKQVKLGPHEEKIRVMLHYENPGKAYEYGCAITRSKGLPEIFTELIMVPEMIRKIDGHRCVRFVINGMFWIYLISSHTKQFQLKEVFLSEDGDLKVFWDYNMSFNFFKRLATECEESGFLTQKTSP